MLGEFSWKEESDGGLDFSGRNGGFLVVLGESRGFVGDSLEDVGHERVHDGHGLGGDTGVGVDLLEDLVDVDRVGLLSLSSSLLLVSGWGSLLDDSFLGSFGGGHFENSSLSLNGENWQRSALFIPPRAGKRSAVRLSPTLLPLFSAIKRARERSRVGFPVPRI